MYINLAQDVNIDAQKLVTGRGCIIGQSGSGKSFLAGVILEELCKQNMPFCVIDTEGEYNILKSQFNILVVGGQNKDIGLNVNYSELFNLSIENDIPIILDVSEIIDKQEQVNLALSSLYELENKIKKPYLVVIEEGDKFAPQTISKKQNIIEEISVRGRKRGIGLLIATQRPANISKTVLSQCSYGLIGKLTIENDINAIKILFSNRRTLTKITQLNEGEFVSFGINYNEAFKVKQRLIKNISSTPSIYSYRPQSGKLNEIINRLKNDTNYGYPNTKNRLSNAQRNKDEVSIFTIHQVLTIDDAKRYAEKFIKRKFIFFGEAIENIESINLNYMPLAECTIRMPTKNKNEFLEYHPIINENCNFILFKDKNNIKLLEQDKENVDNILKKVSKMQIQTDKINIKKESILKIKINEEIAKRCLNKLSENIIFDAARVIYLPIFKITLRRNNIIRIFFIDAVYGNEVSKLIKI